MCQVSRLPSSPCLFFPQLSCARLGVGWPGSRLSHWLVICPGQVWRAQVVLGLQRGWAVGWIGSTFFAVHQWYFDTFSLVIFWRIGRRNFHKFEIVQICIKLPTMQRRKLHVWMDITFVCINVVSCRHECICSKIHFCICLNFKISRSLQSERFPIGFLLEGSGRFRKLSGAGVWTGVMAWGRCLNLVTHKKIKYYLALVV